MAACLGVRRRQRARTTRANPSNTVAIPISHSSESSAPVNAIAGLVLTDAVGEVVVAGDVAGGVVAGDVAGCVAAGVTVTLPGT